MFGTGGLGEWPGTASHFPYLPTLSSGTSFPIPLPSPSWASAPLCGRAEPSTQQQTQAEGSVSRQRDSLPNTATAAPAGGVTSVTAAPASASTAVDSTAYPNAGTQQQRGEGNPHREYHRTGFEHCTIRARTGVASVDLRRLRPVSRDLGMLAIRRLRRL